MTRKIWFAGLLTILLAAGFAVLPGTKVYASQIDRLELAELVSRAQAIALAKVVKIDKKSLDSRKPTPYDEVTITIASVLKGEIKQEELKITLQPRGVKDFYPVLKTGDTGIFFLRDINESNAKLAYWGSVAVFQKDNFKVSMKPKEPKEMDSKSKRVKLETTMGNLVIELNQEAAPVTVENFLRYVNEGFYNETIFHRIIPNFMIQGGGFTADMRRKNTHEPIVNEAKNGLKNNRGTIAMARTNEPDSATSQFFINHKNNDFLNYAGPGKPGYAVFGRVIEGMDVVDKIAAVKTTRKGPYANVPVEPVAIKSTQLISGK
jgi:cyclophilin family peptidyl-prolyl cis-trans isomerase